MSIEVVFNENTAEAVVTPAYGKRVAFVVERRTVTVSKTDAWMKKRSERWVVGLRGSNGEGFGWHTTYDRACKSLLSRARRYEQAYSVPRGLAAREAS